MNYLKVNREAWDKRTKIHVGSEFYDVAGFLDGKSSLREIELGEMPDVDGKTLLHLQCHFGLDTLSWARKGAIATGLDLSPEAIKQANQLKDKANLEATFICADIYEFGEQVIDTYDVVFTSYGAINWLPSIERWAGVVSKCLKPGGIFYMAEFHSIYELMSGYPYFYVNEGIVEEGNSYTDRKNSETMTMVTWTHPMSSVINALIDVGIQIKKLNEFPFSPYDCFDGLEEREKGRFYLADSKHDIPLVYSIMGNKDV